VYSIYPRRHQDHSGSKRRNLRKAEEPCLACAAMTTIDERADLEWHRARSDVGEPRAYADRNQKRRLARSCHLRTGSDF
jgi:hypothetical protein